MNTHAIFFQSLFLEAGQAFGETIFLLHVLPRSGLLTSLGMFYSVGVFPALLKVIFFRPNREDPTLKRSVIRILDVLALLAQLGAIAYPLVLNGLQIGVYDLDSDHVINLYWEVPLSLLLISTKW